MADPHVVTGLVAKRRELAGLIEHTQASLRQLLIDLDNVDATLRLFAPDIDLEAIRPKPLPPRQAAAQGEVVRVVLGTLRNAGRALTTQEITAHVIAERGLNTADRRLLKLVTKRVGACLRHHRKRGLVRSKAEAGRLLAWEIAHNL